MATVNYAEEYAKCAVNEWYWMCNYVKIVDRRTGQVVPFQPWQHLFKTWENYVNHRRIVILKARQVGMSWFWAAIALHRGIFKPYSNTILLSINQPKAIDLRKKSYDIWTHLPDWMRIPSGKDNQEILDFPSMDSQIKSLPAKPDSVRGESAGLIVLDEHAFWEYDYESWTSILLAGELGTIVCVSTAQGRNNKFYEIWDEAEQELNGFIPLFFPWNVVPERDATWLAEQEKQLKVWERRQELPTHKEDAFVIAGDCYFDIDVLKEAQHYCATYSKEGHLEFYEPINPEDTYSVGVDTALGVMGGDYSCAQFISNTTGRQVAKLRARIPPEQFAELLYDTLIRFQNPFCLIEELPVGRILHNTLVSNGYPLGKLYFRSKTIPCWYTSEKNRPDILSQLETGVRLGLLRISSRNTIDEMFSFGWNEKKKKWLALSGNDDEVMSLALAWYAKTDAYQPTGELTPKHFVVSDKVTSLESINWKKRDPFKNLQSEYCPACHGMRLVDDKPCNTCKGLGVILCPTL